MRVEQISAQGEGTFVVSLKEVVGRSTLALKGPIAIELTGALGGRGSSSQVTSPLRRLQRPFRWQPGALAPVVSNPRRGQLICARAAIPQIGGG